MSKVINCRVNTNLFFYHTLFNLNLLGKAKMYTTQPTLKDFLTILFKRRKIITIVFLSTVFVVGLGTLLAKSEYEAKSQVLVKFGRENVYSPPNEVKNYFTRYSNEDLVLPEIELIKSRSLIEQVIDDIRPRHIYPGLDRNETLLELQSAINAAGNANSNVITITFRHTDPKIAAMVVNKLVSIYLDQHLKIHQNPQSYVFFEEQTVLLKNKLESSEMMLKEFKSQYNLTALEDEQRILLNQIADLTNGINRLSGENADINNRIGQLRIQLKTIPKTVSQGEEVEYNPDLIRNLEEKLVELELKENELLAKYKPQSRMVTAVNNEINVIKRKLSEYQSKRYGRSHTGPNATYQRLKEDLYQNIITQKANIAKQSVQKDQLITLKNQLNALNDVEVQFNHLKQKVEVDRQNYTLYLTKFEEARISNEMDKKKISNVNLIQSALAPFQPVSPKVSQRILLGLLFGFLGGIGIAFLLEYFDDTIEQPADVDKFLELPVFTSIPDFNTK